MVFQQYNDLFINLRQNFVTSFFYTSDKFYISNRDHKRDDLLYDKSYIEL